MSYLERPATAAKSMLSRVYGWMTAGLLVTAATAYYVAHTPAIIKTLYTQPFLILALVLVQLGLVMFLSFRIQRMSFAAAVASFIAYSLLTGLTLSGIFLVYTQQSIAITFVVCAGMFLAMALYGFFTNADLSGMGSFLFMGLIGLMIALFVNMFLKSSQLDYVISAFGVVVFALLTAYDVQRIKVMSQQMQSAGVSAPNIAIYGALTLYLDFVNLFIYLLRFLGQSKDR